RGSDPDFAAKEELIADRVIALNARLGPAKSPEDAVQRATQAHKEVTEHLRGMLPRRQEMRRSPESASTSHIAPAPKNLLDVVDQALKVGT
ncbi:hypothetical protein, partial [Mycolicibacterium sp.]|uniref:hypothetical protein n=1 Tax=Mycolicibacterium sp. TaxID=2320850 RepID=UPI00355F6A27